MKSIIQQNNFGCGLACIAFILRKNYQDILTPQIIKKANSTGFTCKELVKILKKHNLNYTYKYLKPNLKNKIYQDNTIVFIKRSKKYPFGHYLVRYENTWMDPWPKSNNLKIAKSGFRKKLPGKPIYAIFSLEK